MTSAVHQREEEFAGHQHPGYALGPRKLQVTGLTYIADQIMHIELAHPEGTSLAPYQPGSHLIVAAGQGRRNAYSLTGDGMNPHHYEVSVLRLGGGGGSAWLHDHLEVGQLIGIEGPRATFPAEHHQSHALLVAGGIGVTPVLSHARALARSGESATILYSYRPGRGAHLDDLRELVSTSIDLIEVTSVLETEAALMTLLADQPFGTHAYACGPAAMLTTYEAAALAAGWPPGRVHLERFVAPELDPGSSFTVTVASTGQTIEIPSGVSMLDGLLGAGVQVSFLCKQGVCGECRIAVTAATTLEHRDFVLSADERQAATHVMACVSRGRDIEVNP